MRFQLAVKRLGAKRPLQGGSTNKRKTADPFSQKRQIERPLHVDFIVASSYGAGTVSSGTVRLVYDPETSLEGKHLLLVDDIVDSGRTLQELSTILRGRKPKSIALCALFHKHIATELSEPVRFFGFDAP